VPAPRDDEALIRVEAAAICGTDVDEVRLGPITVPVRPHPVSGRAAPITLGHEIVGVVVEAGPAAGLAVGDRVAPWPSRPCGRCRDCETGHANRCPSMVSLGMSVDGGMAEFLVADGRTCAPVGTDVAIERAVLVEPFAVALHAAHRVEIAGRRVAVVGIGSLGLCMLEVSIQAGAEEVIGVSRSEVARAAALDAGATAAVAFEAADGLAADVVFETAGEATAVGVSMAAARRGGQVLILGGHPQPTPVDLLDLVVRELDVRGSVSHCQADFVAAAEAITAGDLARARRHVELAPLDAGPELLRIGGGAAKHVLVPGLRQ